MADPTAAMLVIGDEILSGRTRDANMYHLAGELTIKGIKLREVRVVPDTDTEIIIALNDLRHRYDHVFTSGGIGPTHDDITADCIAKAFGVNIGIREDARAILEAHYTKTGKVLNASRLRMARIPEGATLIENPVSAAPGFTISNVHVMAGVPTVFHAMVASLLPTISGGSPLLSRTVRLNQGEGDIAVLLGDLDKKFHDINIGSYPFQDQGKYGTNIVLRGTQATRLDDAVEELVRLFPDTQLN